MKNLSIKRFPEMSYSCTEAINTLCTNLSFAGKNVRKIMITSTNASEGKSYISMNIMRALTRLGYSVALVDADLRRSNIARKYQLRFEDEKDHPGLTHLLADMVSDEDVVYKTNIEGAYFVPAGQLVLNSLALLTNPNFSTLLNRLAVSVDYVLVDSPPVGTIIDAAEIAKSCDGTLIVVNWNTVRRQELLEVKSQLQQTGCPILGTVLNQVEFDNYMSRKYYQKSYYKSYYAQRENDKGTSEKKHGRKHK